VNEKKKKTLRLWCAVGETNSGPQEQKFFGSFFQKRTAFFQACAGRRWIASLRSQ
jgi:hypothetical protein